MTSEDAGPAVGVGPSDSVAAGAARNPTIGAVAIGRNEGDRLRRCLAALKAQGLPIVYVDSNSTDGSADHARSVGADVVMLDPDVAFTAARARNAGWRRLRALHPGCALIQFVDGDCELERGWITIATTFLADYDDVAIVCGRRRERFPAASFYNRLCDEEWNTPIGEAAASGGDFLARADVLEAVGGFDASLMAGEEPEMCSRIRRTGWRIWRIDAPMTIHDAAMTRFGQWWRRAIRSGAGYAQAWRATAGAPVRLYARELRSAFAWAVVLPLSSIALAIAVHPAWLLLPPVLWLLQIVRLSRAHGWGKATLFMVGKAAEMIGVAHWARQSVAGAPRHAVTYK